MIHFIVFSRARPLQLHGYLTSLISNLHAHARISVLVKMEEPYAQAYVDLSSEFPEVSFDFERSFPEQMDDLVHSPAELICFGCDDVVIRRFIDMNNVADLLGDERIIGVSLRLGLNITTGMFNNSMQQPPFVPGGRGEFVTWDMREGVGDWCYPWDVLGTIYRSEFVHDMWPHLQTAINPSQFEGRGAEVWPMVSQQRMYACWEESRSVIPTPNVVQTEFGNGFVGTQQLDPVFLLDCWQHGMRLDTERYAMESFSGWRIPDVFLKRVP